MKAAQIMQYSKKIQISVNDIPVPEVGDHDILIRVKAAAVNPVDMLNLTGAVRLIQDYKMPLTIAIPLTGLTAYQAFTEELQAKPGETVFLAGGSGSFGQMAVPIAKALGLRVVVSGNARAKDAILSAGADRYMVYSQENYWELLSDVDYVIDGVGKKEFQHQLSVLKKGGILLSLHNGPNRIFAEKNGYGFAKKMLFTLAGSQYDKLARREGKEYRFLFVRADGVQLEEISRIVEKHQIAPQTDPRVFDLLQINDAMKWMEKGQKRGKVILRFS